MESPETVQFISDGQVYIEKWIEEGWDILDILNEKGDYAIAIPVFQGLYLTVRRSICIDGDIADILQGLRPTLARLQF